MLACGSLVLIGLSHFLQFTRSFGSRRVLSVIPHAPFCHSHRSANPHKSCRFSRLLRSISLSFTTRADIFSHALFLWLCKETFPASPPHISALSVHSRSLRFAALYTPALAFSNPPVQAKKCDQPCCKQHPATALCASRVRGTRSTRSGSPTTLRLHCSFASLISHSALLSNARSRLCIVLKFVYSFCS